MEERPDTLPLSFKPSLQRRKQIVRQCGGAGREDGRLTQILLTFKIALALPLRMISDDTLMGYSAVRPIASQKTGSQQLQAPFIISIECMAFA